jgi:hypothetical protein
MSEDLKVCRKCHLELPITEFSVTNKATGLRRSWCKSCESARVRAYYAANPEYRATTKTNTQTWFKTSPKAPAIRRRARLKGKYDLTEAQFAQMLAEQDGRCALCKTDEIGVTGASGRYDGSRKWLPGSWRVDHCHKDGRVRGLLCHACNTQLGGYETLIDRVGRDALLDYLTRPSPVPDLPVLTAEDVRATARFVAELPPLYVRGKCSVEGCGDDQHANDLCFKHYMRVRRGRDAGPAGALPHAGSKLTDDDIRAIRASADKAVVIAARYGISQGTISLIRNNKIWTHVI